MKRLFKIASILLLLFLITAEDCSNNSSEMTRNKIQTEQFRNIENGFVNDEISREALRAFEKRATQKVKDFDDFITIYLDGDLEKEFRVQAKNMTYNTFKSIDDCHRFFSNIAMEEDDGQVLLYKPDFINKVIFRADSIYILEEIQKNNVLQYSGKIGFNAGLYEIINNDTILIDKNRLDMAIIVVKKEKNFGTGSEKVWEVLMGDTRKSDTEL